MRMGISRRRFKKRYIIIPLLLLAVYYLMVRLQPAFLSLAHESANQIITADINNTVSNVFKNYRSDMFYSENGDTFISNVAEINMLKTDIISELYDSLTNNGGLTVKIPIGSASGLYLLNGAGPCIPVKVYPTKTIQADFENGFESAGINFVKHTLYINIAVTVNYRGFILNEQETITSRIPVIENITSGSVPNYYGGNMSVVGN